MKSKIKTTDKKVYHSPDIEFITMDNEISLALESPASPPEWPSKLESHETDPFKTNLG